MARIGSWSKTHGLSGGQMKQESAEFSHGDEIALQESSTNQQKFGIDIYIPLFFKKKLKHLKS